MGKQKLNWRHFPAPCLVCGVDSWSIKVFLAAFIGSLVVATIAFLLWAFATGRNGKDENEASHMAIEADKRE